MELHLLLYVISFLIILFIFSKKSSKTRNYSLPPGPKKLPIVGNILELAGEVQHRVLRDFAKKYGPIMHLQLAEISIIVVSSSHVAKNVLKTHDLNFADRAQIQLSKIIVEDTKDVVFNLYDDYWRQMKKVCTVELLTTRKVKSFRAIREDEGQSLVESIISCADKPINLTHKFASLTNAISCRAATGERSIYQDDLVRLIDLMAALGGAFDIADLFPSYRVLHVFSGVRSKLQKVRKELDEIFNNIIKEHEEKRANTKMEDGRVQGEEDLVDVLLRVQEEGSLQFPITSNNIQGIICDMLTAGTETTSTALDWAMSEIVKNPRVMQKVQTEVRQTLRGKSRIQEVDVQGLSYLKLVIKETLRLHPPAPLLLPKVCREQCEIEGYTIPVKTRLLVNAWAIQRDPAYWDDAEAFVPERFENKAIDYSGADLNYIPFGAGRRSCPGVAFGLGTMELPLAVLLYHFNWTTPNGDDLDMNEKLGFTLKRKTNLILSATPWTD